MVAGLLQIDLHLPRAQSLKDKRSVLKSLKDQVRAHFNVAVAEVDPNELWQRATIGIATVGDDRGHVQGVLRQVTEWMRTTRLVELIQVEEEYL